MNVSARWGTLIIARDPLLDRIGLIYLPDTERKLAPSALCLMHSQRRLEENLSGKRIIIDRFSGTPWTLALDGVPHEFWTIPETAVLAVYEDTEGEAQ